MSRTLNLIVIIVLSMIIVSSCQDDDTIPELADFPRRTICEDIEKDDRVGAFCNPDTCDHYLPIWKELFQSKNNLSKEFFDSHISIQSTGLNVWLKGISFYVCYEFQIGWASTYTCDDFIIRIDDSSSLYPHLVLPRDTFLAQDEIAVAVEGRAFGSDIKIVNNSMELISPSLENAMSELVEFAGVDNLCFNRINIDRWSGNLTLHAAAQYVKEENACIYGSYDLITGKKEVFDSVCYIH